MLSNWLFPNIIFLLILWVFYIIYSYHIHFPVLPWPCHPCSLVTSLSPHTHKKSNLYYTLYTHWGVSKLSLVCPLNRAESFFNIPAGRHVLWRWTPQHPITGFKSSLPNGSLFRLLLVCWGRDRVEVGVEVSLFQLFVVFDVTVKVPYLLFTICGSGLWAST
jgi:hypothetical protein